MTVIELREGEAVVIGGGVILTATRVRDNGVRLGIAAGPDVQITRPDAARREPKLGRMPQREFGHR